MKNRFILLLTIGMSCPLSINASESNASESIEDTTALDEINVVGASEFSSDPLSGTAKPNDIVVSKQKLKRGASTLGNALSNELSVHSNQFGGGASAPVIRGQEGVRLKILQNGSDVVDMSQLSPDHAVGVDSLLAERVEILRGASTLLYANASPAGVINVIDNRIPTAVPEKGYQADLSLRQNTNNGERLATTGITLGLNENLAFRFEGLSRYSGNYHVPEFNLGSKLNFVPDSYNKTKSGTYGLSYIGERGYLGFAYNERKEIYGLPGHNHALDTCGAHIWGREPDNDYYLELYPHLMGDKDLVNTHFHCGSNHALGGVHNHDNPYGHNHDHTLGGPVVDSYAKRYDLRAEIKEPLRGFDKLRLSYSSTNYRHDERDGHIPVNIFHNKGTNVRLELLHQPIRGLSGVWGVQYQTSTSSANIPRIPPCSNSFTPDGDKKRCPEKITDNDRQHWALIENNNDQYSLFALEQLRLDSWLFEAAVRTEKQKIAINHDTNRLRALKKEAECSALFGTCLPYSLNEPDLSLYHKWATSYSLSASWNFLPDYALSLIFSHNERHPTPMELYYHGKHLATVSFEHGNRYLNKEVSDNVEAGLSYFGDKLSYHVSVYLNNFKNRIFNQTLSKEGNLSLNRYSQSQAKYYGIEGRLDYNVTPEFSLGLFGDYIRGKLSRLPPTYEVDPIWGENIAVPQKDQNAPRVPPARLGFRTNAELTRHLSGTLEYVYVFKQHKVAPLEQVTSAHGLLNLGMTYAGQLENIGYEIFIQGNNLLNQKVYSHTSFLPFVPQMGRNVTLGININF
ncbi:iron complex outermembrane recepter protein [Pasteurella testudinis DSM 23072]|uniref:Iron complex outermembrane recepter protein n=1 Tax=Pasteurella testudinis DSM 23072 TaxID=1122938 RepID=A0A1W1UZD5_9PAST|nr:TonB-dependent receptor [Pasteurella testudinis]SMB86463.1 iron complex outermembrane recepter protein [Pasteurella testudinis DSM 23072]SUB51804.1 TonB-dependent receptor, beta-barrel domain protein [Pasteurella testudinis]